MKRGRELAIPERPEQGRLLAGVSIGLAERFGFDVTLMRLAFIVLAFAWGLGVLLYLALWLVMPREGMAVGGRVQDTIRQNLHLGRTGIENAGKRFAEAWSRDQGGRWPVPPDRRWLGVGLVAAGVLVLMISFGLFSWVTPVRALGLAAIALGVAALGGMRSKAQ